MNNEILDAHQKAKLHKRKVDEDFYQLRSDVDTYTRSMFDSCTDDECRKEINRVRSSNGLLPLTWAKVHLTDAVFQLLISKVFSGKRVKDAIADIESVMTFDIPLSTIIRQHHPYDWMDKHRNTIKCSIEYTKLIRDIGLHNNANILSKDKRPYTLLRRLERIVQRINTYREMESELTESGKQIEQLKAELKVIQMRIAMTTYDIEALKKKLLEEPDPFERFKWTINKFPDISTKDLITYIGVSRRQITRYKEMLDSCSDCP